MKKVILTCVFALMVIIVYGQQLRGNYNAADYQAYDSTTFFLTVPPGAKTIIADYSDLNANDAVLSIGTCLSDGKGSGNLSWTSTGGSSSSLTLDVTTNAITTKNSAGVRSITTRAYLYFPYGFPTPIAAVTIIWNSVTTGRIKFYI